MVQECVYTGGGGSKVEQGYFDWVTTGTSVTLPLWTKQCTVRYETSSSNHTPKGILHFVLDDNGSVVSGCYADNYGTDGRFTTALSTYGYTITKGASSVTLTSTGGEAMAGTRCYWTAIN